MARFYVSYELMQRLQKCMYAKVGEFNYDPKFDVNTNGEIDIDDITFFAQNYGAEVWLGEPPPEVVAKAAETQIPVLSSADQAALQAQNMDLQVKIALSNAQYYGQFYKSLLELPSQLAVLPSNLAEGTRALVEQVLTFVSQQEDKREGKMAEAVEKLGISDVKTWDSWVKESDLVAKALESDDWSDVPEEKVESYKAVAEIQTGPDNVWDLLNPTTQTFLEAKTLQDWYDKAFQVEMDLWRTMKDTALRGGLISDLSRGVFNGGDKAYEFLERFTGASSIVSQLATLEWQLSVWPHLTRYYNAKWMSLIPPYTDLINMRVKEKITQRQFEQYLGEQGFNSDWSRRIWDAHFYPPTLGDILTAWRRKIPLDLPYADESSPTGISVKHVDKLELEDVHSLMKLVDLDPVYQDVFDTRLYIDPPISMARWMFETGSIDADKVLDYVKKAGYRDDDALAVQRFIVGFQERRWKTRYLMQLAQGYRYGVYKADEIKDAARQAGYQLGVAEWVIKTADVQKRIADTVTPRAHREKLLSPSDLKRAYIRYLRTEDQIRVELLDRGYSKGDIDLVVVLWNEEREMSRAGKPIIGLTITQLLAAWRYGVIDDVVLTDKLVERGMTREEIDILITTEKKKVGAETSGAIGG